MIFPHDLTLSEVTDVIARHNAALGANIFIRAERGPFVIFNYTYQFPEAFPPFTGDPALDREVGIIRECRGLIFYADTGEIASRRYQKYWNIGQNEEAQPHNIDFNRPHVIMDKLDGSMVAPCLYDGAIEWHTKMGRTNVADQIEEFVSTRPHYDALARKCIENGMTPLFEWTSMKQIVVLRYPVDNLVLMHVRDNQTGEYMSREYVQQLGDFYGIDVVKTFDGSAHDIHAFVEYTRGLKDLEGFVIQFQNGEMYKIKADDYCLLHRSKEEINQEKNVVAMVFAENFDDLLANFDNSDYTALVNFNRDALAGVRDSANSVMSLHADISSKVTTRAEYAKMVSTMALPDPLFKGLLFKALDGRDIFMEIIKIIREHTATANRVEKVRFLFGNICWLDYRGIFDGDA